MKAASIIIDVYGKNNLNAFTVYKLAYNLEREKASPTTSF